MIMSSPQNHATRGSSVPLAVSLAAVTYTMADMSGRSDRCCGRCGCSHLRHHHFPCEIGAICSIVVSMVTKTQPSTPATVALQSVYSFCKVNLTVGPWLLATNVQTPMTVDTYTLGMVVAITVYGAQNRMGG